MKLENVLVHGERRERPLILYTVKITDFGLSKAGRRHSENVCTQEQNDHARMSNSHDSSMTYESG